MSESARGEFSHHVGKYVRTPPSSSPCIPTTYIVAAERTSCVTSESQHTASTYAQAQASQSPATPRAWWPCLPVTISCLCTWLAPGSDDRPHSVSWSPSRHGALARTYILTNEQLEQASTLLMSSAWRRSFHDRATGGQIAPEKRKIRKLAPCQARRSSQPPISCTCSTRAEVHGGYMQTSCMYLQGLETSTHPRKARTELPQTSGQQCSGASRCDMRRACIYQQLIPWTLASIPSQPGRSLERSKEA
ncbi:hypothetical protein C8T65DRAFT_292360 [Cerioporus squamosus]|nr:hypothetical protein C8T65DRAFT_292360 [Cerioporus squamosus]